MSSPLYNYRGGKVETICIPTAGDASVKIQPGDLVGVDGGVAYPASHWATAATFAAAFAGVALTKVGLQTGETTANLTTDPGYVVVAKSGLFAFTCATGISWLANSRVKMYVTGGYCVDKTVALTALYSDCIGLARLGYSALGVTTLTEVVVDIKPAYTYDSVKSGV